MHDTDYEGPQTLALDRVGYRERGGAPSLHLVSADLINIPGQTQWHEHPVKSWLQIPALGFAVCGERHDSTALVSLGCCFLIHKKQLV
jgi:hypothetical protein